MKTLKLLTPFLWLSLAGLLYFIRIKTGPVSSEAPDLVSTWHVPMLVGLLFLLDLLLKYFIGTQRILWVWMVQLLIAAWLLYLVLPVLKAAF